MSFGCATVHPTAATMPSPFATAGTMQSGYPVEIPPAATYQAPVGAAAKPSYEELEHACALLQGHCQALWNEKNFIHHQATMEVSRLTEANRVQKGAIEKAKKVFKGLISDRQRLRVDNRRLKLKLDKLEQSCGAMVVDTDASVEAQCARLQGQNAALEEELKGLQREYMELVEKSDNEQKSASALLSEVQDRAIKDAESQAATAKETEKMMEKKVRELKREVKELRESYSSSFRKHCVRFEKECRKHYEKQLVLAERELSDRLSRSVQSLQQPTPSSSPASFPSSSPRSTTPCTLQYTPPTPLSSLLAADTPKTPQTPTPLSKTKHWKECESLTDALSLAQQEHLAVRGAATHVLQQYQLDGGIERTDPTAALEAAHKGHERVRESAVSTLQGLGAVEEELKGVLSQRGRQQRLWKREEEACKGRKPKRLSRQ